jgi:hypothetical protein
VREKRFIRPFGVAHQDRQDAKGAKPDWGGGFDELKFKSCQPDLDTFILKPFPDDYAHTGRLRRESHVLIELNDVFVGLQVDVLPWEMLQYATDHFLCNATPTKTRLSPDIYQIRIADSVGEHAGRSHNQIAGPCDANDSAIVKGHLQLLCCSAVVKMICGERRL